MAFCLCRWRMRMVGATSHWRSYSSHGTANKDTTTVQSDPNEVTNSVPTLGGWCVVSFETRMGEESRRMIERHGATVLSAPALKEVPLKDQTAALQFGEQLMLGQVDVLVLLTGVGTRALIEVLCTRWDRAAVLTQMEHCTLVCRGPKPVAVLKGHELKPDVVVPEPNTWRDLVNVFEQNALGQGKRVFVQEYGRSNEELLLALKLHADSVTAVPVYAWTLPDDTGPLKSAISEMTSGNVQLACFTTGVQVQHLFEVAGELDLAEPLRQVLSQRMVIASIGPLTTERLQQYGLTADIEPEHPKLGHMILAMAARAQAVLTAKLRRGAHPQSQ